MLRPYGPVPNCVAITLLQTEYLVQSYRYAGTGEHVAEGGQGAGQE